MIENIYYVITLSLNILTKLRLLQLIVLKKRKKWKINSDITKWFKDTIVPAPLKLIDRPTIGILRKDKWYYQ